MPILYSVEFWLQCYFYRTLDRFPKKECNLFQVVRSALFFFIYPTKPLKNLTIAFQMAPKKPAMAFHAFVKKFPLSFRIALVSKLRLILLKVSPALSTILSFKSDKVFVKLLLLTMLLFERFTAKFTIKLIWLPVTVVSSL